MANKTKEKAPPEPAEVENPKVEERYLDNWKGNPITMAMDYPPPKPAHQRPDDLDPETNGPFLDDIRAREEVALQEFRESAEENVVMFPDQNPSFEPGPESEALATMDDDSKREALVNNQPEEEVAPVAEEPPPAEEEETKDDSST